jgi:hypothetical protein
MDTAMNMQKLLKNRLAVAVLCLIAGIFVYFNNIAPIMFPKNDGEILPEITVLIEDNQDSVQNVSVSDQDLGLFSDSSAVVTLQKIGWKRIANRDSFINEKRSGAGNTMEKIIEREDLTVKCSSKSVISSQPLLRAISIGSQEKIALIGTRELHEGDRFVLGRILKIDQDSVLIEGPYGIRTIHLKKQ